MIHSTSALSMNVTFVSYTAFSACVYNPLGLQVSVGFRPENTGCCNRTLLLDDLMGSIWLDFLFPKVKIGK